MPKRVDANQKEITAALRKMGVCVAVTSSLGSGFPDIVLGMNGRNYLIELKDGTKPPSARKLTKQEEAFHESWLGQIAIINSLDEAIEFVNRKRLEA